MSNNVVTIDQSRLLAGLSPAMQARLAQLKNTGARAADDLGAGITGGFAVLGYRGKVWRTKYQGEETILTRTDNSGEARASVEVVILKPAPHLAKIYYKTGYIEGSDAPPDCFSLDGKAPDPSSPERQSTVCVNCPHNAFGSRISADGKGGKGKACADSKRLAVVPDGDIRNEALGGAMLLRVPPASLAGLKQYADKLNAIGVPPHFVVTRISFDMNEAYPNLVFTAARMLTDEELVTVEAMREDDKTARVLASAPTSMETGGPSDGQSATTGFVPPTVGVAGAPVHNLGGQHTAVHDHTVGQTLAAPQPIQSAPAPVPAQPNPVQASAARREEVQAKVEAQPLDPNAEKRAQLRKMGVPEATIAAMCGPEPVAEVEEPTDPRVAELTAAGFTPEQIETIIKTMPAPNGAAPAADKPKRTRKPKEADPAPAAAPAPTAPQTAAAPAPQPQEAAPAAAEDGNFDSFLEGLLDQTGTAG